MNEILLNGISLDQLLNRIGQLIESKIGQSRCESKEQNQSKLLSRKETAKLLQTSLPTINNWTKAGLLNSYLIGSRVFYKRDEVEQSLTQRNFNKFRKGGNHAA